MFRQACQLIAQAASCHERWFLKDTTLWAGYSRNDTYAQPFYRLSVGVHKMSMLFQDLEAGLQPIEPHGRHGFLYTHVAEILLSVRALRSLSNLPSTQHLDDYRKLAAYEKLLPALSRLIHRTANSLIPANPADPADLANTDIWYARVDRARHHITDLKLGWRILENSPPFNDSLVWLLFSCYMFACHLEFVLRDITPDTPVQAYADTFKDAQQCIKDSKNWLSGRFKPVKFIVPRILIPEAVLEHDILMKYDKHRTRSGLFCSLC